MNQKKLRVWHIPQVPGKPFHVEVTSVEDGVRVMKTLATYDLFQLENRIKPDYASAQGLEMWEENYDGDGNDGWCSWEYDDGDNYWDDPRAYVDSMKGKRPDSYDAIWNALHRDRFRRGLSPDVRGQAMNQCDGCRSGLPIRNGLHFNPETGSPTQGCEKGRYMYRVDVWEERDRLSIVLYEGDSEVASWWDDDARLMFEHGFFERGRRLEASVIEYAYSVDLIWRRK